MKKLQLLHQYLIDQKLFQPEQLNVVVSKGKNLFACAAGAEELISFERRYTVEVIVNAWGGDIDMLDLALVWWLSQYQPDLAGDHGYGFEADVVNAETVNLYINIPLSERIYYDVVAKELKSCVKPITFDELAPLPFPLELYDSAASEVVPYAD